MHEKVPVPFSTLNISPSVNKSSNVTVRKTLSRHISRMASRKVTDLQDLPPEILTLICTHLCHHCFSYDINLWKPSCDSGGILQEERELRRRGLSSLAAASRRLRRAARPVLWHRLQPKRAGPEAREKLLCYIRFLHENKEMRPAVRSLVVDGRDERCTCCLHITEFLVDEELRLAKKASKTTGLPFMMQDFNAEDCTEKLVEILLSMLPSLTEIHISIPESWAFDNLHVWRYTGVAMGEGPRRYLSNVKRMEIETGGGERTNCYPGHADCIVPTYKSQAEQVLIESAPSLEVLSCTAGGLDSLPFLPRLKYLELQPMGIWDKITQLFDHLPNLTHLRYCFANEHSPSPRILQHALEPLAGTLECLSVSAQRFITRPSFGSYDDWEPPAREDWTMESLESFTSLKHLTIDAGMIWRGRGKEGNREFDARDNGKMAHFLPSSIETVFIDDLYGDIGPLFPLAQSVATGHYPNLKLALWYEVQSAGEVQMLLGSSFQSDWLVDDNWKSQLCGSEDWAHIRTAHTLSEGHLVAFPDWDGLYQEHCRRHQLTG